MGSFRRPCGGIREHKGRHAERIGSIQGRQGVPRGSQQSPQQGPGNPKSARNVTNIEVSAKSLGSTRAVPRKTSGGSCGSLGKPWGVSGAPWVVTGGSLGRPWGISGAPWEVPEGPWGVPGVFQGASGAPLGRSWRFTKSLKNHWFLLYFQLWGGLQRPKGNLREHLGEHTGALGSIWEHLGSFRRPCGTIRDHKRRHAKRLGSVQ